MKTDAEIEKDKEAVAKMIGAKSAMEAMLRRHDQLKAALEHVASIADEIAASFGDNISIQTYRHGENGGGLKTVSVKYMREQMRQIKDRAL